MRRKPDTEFNALNLILGLLAGFFLGATVVYWHTNRQSDRIVLETIDRISALFSSHAIQLESGDSVLIINDEQEGLTRNSNRSAFAHQGPSIVNSPYRIAQDKLVFTRTINIESDEIVSDASKRLDSLLGNRQSNGSDQLLIVEFWESPLNSVGYKMGKNKLLLYGINSFDVAGIYKHRGKMYVKYINDFYPIEITTSFKPLIPSTDPYLSQFIN